MTTKRKTKTYFLLAPGTGLVKIGKSVNPVARITQLRTLNAAPLEPVWMTDIPEADFHKRFAGQRHHGEWFVVTGLMVKYFSGIKQVGPACRLRRELERATT